MNVMFESWNMLLDVRIRPLRSKNARAIFQIFLEMGHQIALTTLDIERKLRNASIFLDKKEINGWLGSLLKAGLISREKKRGKPTTFQYVGKYTFDLWKVTQIGINVAHGLTHFSRQNIFPVKLEPKFLFESVKNLNDDETKKIFRQINEVDILSQVFILMSKGTDYVSSSSLSEGLKLSSEMIDRILGNYLENSEMHFFIKKTSQYGIKERFLNILGLPTGAVSYSFTEEGKRVASIFKRL